MHMKKGERLEDNWLKIMAVFSCGGIDRDAETGQLVRDEIDKKVEDKKS